MEDLSAGLIGLLAGSLLGGAGKLAESYLDYRRSVSVAIDHLLDDVNAVVARKMLLGKAKEEQVDSEIVAQLDNHLSGMLSRDLASFDAAVDTISRYNAPMAFWLRKSTQTWSNLATVRKWMVSALQSEPGYSDYQFRVDMSGILADFELEICDATLSSHREKLLASARILGPISWWRVRRCIDDIIDKERTQKINIHYDKLQTGVKKAIADANDRARRQIAERTAAEPVPALHVDDDDENSVFTGLRRLLDSMRGRT